MFLETFLRLGLRASAVFAVCHIVFWYFKPAHAVYVSFHAGGYAFVCVLLGTAVRMDMSDVERFDRLWTGACVVLALPFYVLAWFKYEVFWKQGYWAF